MVEKGNKKKVEMSKTTGVEFMNKEELLEVIAERLKNIVDVIGEQNKILEGMRKDGMYKPK